MRLSAGMTAVVTGAGGGIGRSLTVRLAAEGLRVVAADVEEAALDATAVLAGTPGVDVSTCVADVADPGAVEALADHAWTTFGGVDLLCNNAGVFQGGLLWECSTADVEWTLGVNLHGILNAVRAFVPRLIGQGTPAHVVNTASMAGLMTAAFTGPYTISKFAALAASECLAKDLAAVGAPITVSVLCPSLVATGIARSRRNRPAGLAAPLSESGAFVEQVLADTTATGLSADDVAAIVVEAVRRGDFLIPTRPSYAGQIGGRTEDLLALRLPRTPDID